MAHNLFIDSTGKVSFAAVGEKAWHGLGQYVENAMTAEEAIQLGGLDYTVEKQPLYLANGTEMSNLKATVRQDTGDVLGVVSDAYNIVQNVEAFEFFDSIVDRGEAIFQTAGVLGKGERIFITAKLPDDMLVNGEVIEKYLLLTSGHNGRSPIQVGFTPVRVVCNNTLTAALKGLNNKVTIMHTSNAKQNLMEASRVMGIASKYMNVLENGFNQMASIRITDETLRKYIEVALNPKKEQIAEEEFSKQFTNKVDAIFDFAKSHHTQTTEAAKNTLWGAYNSISGYYHWVKEYDNQESKMKDIIFKGGSKVIASAFEIAMAFV